MSRKLWWRMSARITHSNTDGMSLSTPHRGGLFLPIRHVHLTGLNIADRRDPVDIYVTRWWAAKNGLVRVFDVVLPGGKRVELPDGDQWMAKISKSGSEKAQWSFEIVSSPVRHQSKAIVGTVIECDFMPSFPLIFETRYEEASGEEPNAVDLAAVSNPWLAE